ncbi:hypothetical protein DET61_109191 [Marinobacter nauticus]|uniref:Uncharacterized protein n=1 Tax=Marinobacter nauticus TaxID=2743 RepID=A0A368XI42_MARNT|nr:hypothetical protein DET61_109191 [Marinobacter nauticus]
MRISLEGQATEKRQNLSDNCLKVLKKMFQKIFRKRLTGRRFSVECAPRNRQ